MGIFYGEEEGNNKVMKVRIITANSTNALEDDINQFIQDREIVSITPQFNPGGMSVLIVYRGA